MVSWTFIISFPKLPAILWVSPSGPEISRLEKHDFHEFTLQSYLCDVQKCSLLSRLKLITRELVSRLSIVALTFLPNILGVSFLGPILKRVMCYSEFYCDRLEKFWFFSLLLKTVQTDEASPGNATLTKHDSMSHTHALCFRARLFSIPGQKLSH